MKYWFTWDGTDCRTKGLRLQGMPPIIRPEERVNHVIIPGRSGELTITEGDDIYNSYIQTVTVIADQESGVREAEGWLRGDSYVSFSSQPQLRQKARVINAVEFHKQSKNSDLWVADVQFYCDPLKEQVSESSVTISSSGQNINNPGSVTARPRITLHGSGNGTVRIRSNSLSLEGFSNGWRIDSSLQWVTNSSGRPQMGVYTGDFPVLPPGNSVVQFTGGITSLTVEGRWKYL